MTNEDLKLKVINAQAKVEKKAASAVHCGDFTCRACWLSWLTTGQPPRKEEAHG